MNKLKISAVQTDILWENIDDNLKIIENKIMTVAESDIFVVPEMFTTGFTNNLSICNDINCQKTITFLKDLSKHRNAAICGSIIFKENDRFFNRFLFVEPNGTISFYNKRHLFGLGGETNIFSKGNERIILNYKGFKILPIVCYDLRFPVWIRNKENYDLIIVVANWPRQRQDIWEILLKARAIENQCFVVGVNRIGCDANKINYSGGTAIINYNGKIITTTENNTAQIITATLDKSELETFRKTMPFLSDIDEFFIS